MRSLNETSCGGFVSFSRDSQTLKKLKQVEGIVEEMKRELSKQTCDHERRADTLTLYAYQKRVDEREKRGQEEVAGYTLPEWGIDEVDAPPTSLLDLFAGWRHKYRQLVSSIEGTTTPTEPTHRTVAVEPTVINGEEEEKADVFCLCCADTRSVAEAKQAIITLIVDSDRSFAMPKSYTDLLNEIAQLRSVVGQGSGDVRVTRMFARIDWLVELLVTKVPDTDPKTCRTILQILHALGDILWYEDLSIPLFVKTVILDPLLLIQFVRQVINHHHEAELLSHDELKGLPFWVYLQKEELLLGMKQMLQKFQLVYPSQDEMKWNSDLIVPAFWNSKTPASWLFGYEDVRLVAAIANSDPNKPKETIRVHWEYHFTYEFPDTLFDHLVVTTYSSMMKRTAGPDWIVYAEDGVFACRVMVSRDAKTIERVLHLEAVLGEDASVQEHNKLWDAFDCLSKGIVMVLRRYPDIVATSVALDDTMKKRDLDSLCQRDLNAWKSQWMPPSTRWEKYKQVVQRNFIEEDDWVMLPPDEY